MILRNFRQGNLTGYAVLLLLYCFTTSACAWFKPARTQDDKVYNDEDIEPLQGKRVFDPVTGTWRIVYEVVEKVDTVQWTVLPEDKYPPIASDGSWDAVNSNPDNLETVSSGVREVVLLLPLFARSATETRIDENSTWGLHFYGGARLAFDELQTAGVRLNVQVFDTEGSEATMRNLLRRPEVLKADLLIGPYKRDNVVLSEAFAKREKRPLVVPHTANYGIAEGNPYYIQVNPSLKSHCAAILKHALRQFQPGNMLLVGLEKDLSVGSFEYFQAANKLFSGSAETPPLREVKIDDDPSKFNEINLSPFIKPGKANVVIVPSWSSEAFAYSLLRHLMEFKTNGEEIIVYGLPQWQNFEQVDLEFFEQLQVHISSPSFLDRGDERLRQFQRRFFEAYGTIPREEAFLGYDIMRYFGSMVGQYGRELSARIDAQPYDILRGRFEFSRVVLEPEKHREQLNYFDQLENQFVHILRFRNYQFQLSDLP